MPRQTVFNTNCSKPNAQWQARTHLDTADVVVLGPGQPVDARAGDCSAYKMGGNVGDVSTGILGDWRSCRLLYIQYAASSLFSGSGDI